MAGVRDELEALLTEAVRRAQEGGVVPPVAAPPPQLERPQRPEHGDYASSLALRLARAAGRGANPQALARAIVDHLPAHPAVGAVEIAGPGFINVRLAEPWLASQVDAIIAAGERFGDQDLGRGRRVQVEFVSANPTGPIHVGNGRGAVFGSTIAAVLRAAGYRVETEYYVNDGGSQIALFTATLYAHYQRLCGREAEPPAEGYAGEYMRELAARIHAEQGAQLLAPPGASPPDEIGLRGVRTLVDQIRSDLAELRVRYDSWYSERSLYAPEGRYEQAMRLLHERGYVTEREGATWLASTQLGEDKDNVLVRRDGSPTYFAADIAYHYDKFLVRGFDTVVDIWGADHQGHVSRMRAAVDALGVDPERLRVLIYQLVTLKRGQEVVRLSKRAGDIITLREVLDEVGADACRFFFLSRSMDSQMDFDLELAKRQSNENPVYYVQYAHARIAGILRTAAERGATPDRGDVQLLRHPAELALVREMLTLPELVERVTQTLEPHLLPHYAMELATAFHAFYTECRVVSEDAALSSARLRLTLAARIALARVLGLMGMSAPERM